MAALLPSETSQTSLLFGNFSGRRNVLNETVSTKQKPNVVEPQVIDKQLLREGMIDPLKPDEELAETLDFPKAISVTLSYKNIMFIQNLETLTGLESLRLDNNIIERIENLDHIKNLKWLDLSFNKISKIDGLSSLKKLKDLSLYSNRITILEGLENCRELNVLSVGRNGIAEIRQVDYLRQFADLRCLCLEGNPICSMDNYVSHVLTFLSNLKYLDYRLIDTKNAAAASEAGQHHELTELIVHEQSQQLIDSAKKEREENSKSLRETFLDYTEEFFAQLFNNNVEPEALPLLREYGELKSSYKEKLEELIKNLKQLLFNKSEFRLSEIKRFEGTINQMQDNSEEHATKLIKQTKSEKKKLTKVLSSVGSGFIDDNVRSKSHVFTDQLTQLEAELIGNEVALDERLEEVTDEFESVMSDLLKYVVDKGSDFFRAVEELEKTFSVRLAEVVLSEVEHFQANPHDYDARRSKYLSNREELFSVCSRFSEHHTQVIQTKEDHMQSETSNWSKSFFAERRLNQYKRNRRKLKEIRDVIESMKSEICSYAVSGDQEDHTDR